MCRFAFYLGSEITLSSLVTDPSNSLIHQSYDNQERSEPLNGDGFGIAWYAPKLSLEPAIFRSVSPAWNNPNLRHLSRVTRSSCLLAHVRAASPGLPVTVLNCHPFSHGTFAFMHNGDMGGFLRFRRQLLRTLSDEAYEAIQGSTDSEAIFGLFLDRHRDFEGHPPLERMALAMQAAIADTERMRREAGVEHLPSLLNLVVTDGRRAVISRFTSADPASANSLYTHSGRRYECEDGICRMRESGAAEEHAVIVSSERLSEDPGWQPVDVGHLVVVDSDLRVEMRPLELP